MGSKLKTFFGITNMMTTKEKTITVIQKFNIFCSFFGGFTINMATYFSWLIIPLLMKEHGGTSFQIGLADATTFGLCGLLCPLIGVLLNKKWFPLDDVCRIGFVFQALSTFVIGIYYTTGVELLPIFFILFFQSFGLAFYWSIAEYLLSNEIFKHETNNVISYYAMSWSLGKAIGFLLGGPMKLAFGNTYSLFLAGVIVLFAWLLFPRFPRIRCNVTRTENKLMVQMLNGEITEEFMKSEIIREKKEMRESKKKNVQKFPYHYMLYYLNELVIHFTVYGTVAVFGNQYIDFADEEKIVLKGINDDPGTFASVFLGIIYFSQTATFFLLGKFYQWQYKPWLNIIVQAVVIAISIGMVYIRNGWVLCCFAVPIGFIAGYDMQASVIYALNAGPKIKGKILGLSECVGELTCSLCPLFAGLLATSFNDRRFALYQGIVLQVIGIILCLVLYVVVIYKEAKTGKIYREEEKIEDEEADLSEESSTESSEEKKEKKKSDVEIPEQFVKRRDLEESSTISSSTSSDEDSEKEKEKEKEIQKQKEREKQIEKEKEKAMKKEKEKKMKKGKGKQKENVEIKIDVEIPENLLKKKDLSDSSTLSSTSSDDDSSNGSSDEE